MTKKQKIIEIINILKELFPDAECMLRYNKPYELLIATRLSAQCTDVRVNIVTVPLFERFTSLEEFANADISEIEEYIHSCGLYKTKAKDIKLMCRQLIDDYNGELPDSIEELTKLSGVGRKTANLIMGDIFKQPAVVTDTHLIRICGRLGFTNSKVPQKVEQDLKKILPPEESSDFCHRIVLFGRALCTARNPKCEQCKLQKYCTYKK